MQNLRWKIITCVAVFIIFAGVGVYPLIAGRYGITSPKWLIDRQLKLGLDLQGGVHLVLRVQTDDALRHETEAESERLREALKTAGITAAANITVDSPTQFKIEGIAPEQDAAFRQAAVTAETNFDRSPGAGGVYTFTMRPNVALTLREEAVTQARQTIERRVNELGVAEPSIAQQGANGDEILVQLPGVSDIEPRQADHPVDRPAAAEDRRAGAGLFARGAPGQRPGALGHGDRARRQRRARRCLHRRITW